MSVMNSLSTIYECLFIRNCKRKICWLLVKEGHSRKLTFLSSPIASNHSAFPLTEVSASEVPPYPKEICFERLNSEVSILKPLRQPGRVYATSFCPEGERPATDFASFTRSAKSLFFQVIIHFTIFNAIISEFGACLAQNNKAQRTAIAQSGRLFGSHLDKISRTEWRHEKAAWLLSIVQDAGFFVGKFHNENLLFRGWNFGERLNIVQGIYLRRQNNIRFLEWSYTSDNFCHASVFVYLWEAVASWLVRLTPERTVRVWALAGDIVLCSWARHLTLTVPLSTQVYKWVPANCWGKSDKLQGSDLRWTGIPSRGRRNTSSHFMLQKPG